MAPRVETASTPTSSRRNEPHPGRTVMMRSLLIVLAMALVGLVAGPMIGMLIVEFSHADPNSYGAKEDGFVGFLYGLYIGPGVGFVLGVILALVVSKKSTEHTE
jgi:MFS family permease